MRTTVPRSNIDVHLKETRLFKPDRAFSKATGLDLKTYKKWLRSGKATPEKYWEAAAQELTWHKKWKKTLKWTPPHAQWFVGGKLNGAENCLDRHLPLHGNKAALVWEGEPGEVFTWTYRQLHREVEKFTALLRNTGLKPGDRVAIYMPLVMESIVAMLACARGGFTHTVIFGGFGAEALKDRINDAAAKVVVTADYGWRKGLQVKLREQVDAELKNCPTVEHVVLLERAFSGRMTDGFSESLGRGTRVSQPKHLGRATVLLWHDALAAVSETQRKNFGGIESVDAEHPLFILYTSGTTGKPKGLVHSTGGYLAGALRTAKIVFDLKLTDVYWCTADIGWITGHSYVVYGPLAAAGTVFLYEGAPTHPTPDRFWNMIARHRVSIFYTAPTAIRSFMRLGNELPKKHDLSSLRVLGSVGEPINPEAWMWYHDIIGGGRCPIVDTYWQTETGAIVISPLPGFIATKPGSATRPLPGYDVDVVDKAGKSVKNGTGGYLVIRKPWPSMARTIHGDPERFKKQYFSEFKGGVYFTGDGARRDRDGYIWCLGRVDDVLNVSGHRLGTMEVESALVSHPAVAEAAVVGRPDELKGQGIVAFVTLKASHAAQLRGNLSEKAQFESLLKGHVVKQIGALARPDEIRFTKNLPKTRSGKIMRRLLRELATNGTVQGDTTTLEDLSVIAALQKDEE
ncbi:MAG TPA: acetate--CoA ligase [Oligoflexia bacterium]|nr:acetate--CoA ligase [Oligoflexia bacterium]